MAAGPAGGYPHDVGREPEHVEVRERMVELTLKAPTAVVHTATLRWRDRLGSGCGDTSSKAVHPTTLAPKSGTGGVRVESVEEDSFGGIRSRSQDPDATGTIAGLTPGSELQCPLKGSVCCIGMVKILRVGSRAVAE